MSHTNYNRISTENAVDETVTNVTETEIDETTPVEVEETIGAVNDCLKLNVRKNPNLKAAIVCVIDVGTEVLIEPDESTEEWYKVYVDDKEGFCMKKYITLV